MEISRPSLIIDPDGNAILIGVQKERLGAVKIASTGATVWSKRHKYRGGVARAARSSNGHLFFVASFDGVAEFGGSRIEHDARLNIRCAGQDRVCPVQQPARALLVGELSADGEPIRSRKFGAPSNLVEVSGLALLPDGHLIVTGEFYGPRMGIGPLSLCEMQPGMPAVEEQRGGFRESGAHGADPCSCRGDQRDLFILALDSQSEPIWAKTLALGTPTPQTAVGAGGDIVWAANTSAASGPQTPSSGQRATLSVWELDATGKVLRRRGAARGDASLMATAPDGSVYLSDRRSVQRISVARAAGSSSRAPMPN